MLKHSVAAAALLLAACVGTAPTPGPAAWEFILEADRIAVSGDRLVLTGLPDSVVAFTDRPARMARHMALADVLKAWSEPDILADPPNVAITATVDGRVVTSVVELSHPRLTGGTLQFDMTVLEGRIPAGSKAILYIDAFPTAVNTQIT